MEWIKLQLHVIRSQEYVGCDPTQRATWLNLMAYCVDQENGGRIKNCVNWSDRKWMQLCGVLKTEVTECELFWFVGGDLLIFEYTKDEQKSVQRKRIGGRKGGKKSRKPKENTDKHTLSSASSIPVSTAVTDKTRLDKTILDETREREDPTIEDSRSHESIEMPWHMRQLENPWISQVKGKGAKIGDGNWQHWQTLIEDHTIEAVLQALVDMNGTEKWPEIIEKILHKNKDNQPTNKGFTF